MRSERDAHGYTPASGMAQPKVPTCCWNATPLWMPTYGSKKRRLGVRSSDRTDGAREERIDSRLGGPEHDRVQVEPPVARDPHVALARVEEEHELDSAADEGAEVCEVVGDVESADGTRHEELLAMLVDDEPHGLHVAFVAFLHVDAHAVGPDVRVDRLPVDEDPLRVRLRDRVDGKPLERVHGARVLPRDAEVDFVTHGDFERRSTTTSCVTPS